MTVIASIDGPNRDIYLHADTVGVDLHPMDIYKEMRTLRRTDESLRKFDLFLSAHGNDPKGGGKFTERYVKELQGTRIIPFDVTQVLNVVGTIITDDGQEGVACFDRTPLTPTTRVDINYVPPQVEVVRAEAELLALVKASYSNIVIIDAINGYAGTGTTPEGDYIGTYSAPSNNVTDAKTIATSLGLSTLKFIGNYSLTENVDGWTVEGQSIGRTLLTAVAGCSTSDIAVSNARVTGVLDGAVSFTDCFLTDISGVGCATNAMTWKNCQIDGTIQLRLDNIVDLHILNCSSGVAGANTPILDINNTATELDIRNYIGGIEVINFNQPNNVSIDLEGHIILQGTISNGNFVIRGRGKKTIATTGTAVVDSENFLQTSSIQESIDRTNYIGKDGLGVTVNSVTGTDSGISPYGTRGFPCKTEQNIQDLASAFGIKNVYFENNFTITQDHSLDTHNFHGDSAVAVLVTCDAVSNVSNCNFKDVHLTGKLGSGTTIREGVVGNVTNASSFMYTCALYGTIQITDSISIEDCWISPLAVNQELIIDFQGLAKTVIVSDWSAGKIRPINMVPGSFFTMAGTAGIVLTDISNTGGTINIGGVIGIERTYLANLDLFNNLAVSGQIWGALDEDHEDQIGTYGEIVHKLRYLEYGIFVDESLGAVGNGSQRTPYNNITNAIDHAEAEGISKLIISSDIILDRALKNFTIEGRGTPTISCNGQNLKGTRFYQVQLEGTYIDSITAQECVLLNGFYLNGFFEKNALMGDLHCTDGANVFLLNNASGIGGTGRPTISMASTLGTSLSVRGNKGGITVKNCNHALNTVTVEVSEGELKFDASNTLGEMVARGVCEFTNLASGATVHDQVINPSAVDAIWKIMGLDKANPVTTTQDTIDVGNIHAKITGDGVNISTINRLT